MERARALARPARHQYWPQWLAFMWLSLGLAALLSMAACSRIASAEVGPGTNATISGTVRGQESRGSMHGRTVEVVNVDTHERHRLTTNDVGRFTLAVRPGKYRVELALRDGESLIESPGEVMVSGGPAIQADFVVGTRRVSRPRGPAYRTDDGLGSPIA